MARRRSRDAGQTISIGRLVVVKAALVSIALAATVVLRGRVPGLNEWLAAWLALTLALGGPAIHHRLLVGSAGSGRKRWPSCPTTGVTVGRGRRPAVAIVCAIVVILAACGAAGAFARNAIEQRITAAVRRHLTGALDVGIGATPALFDLARGSVSTVTIRAASTALCSLNGIDATAVLHGVRREGVARTEATVELTADTVTGLLEGSFPNTLVTFDPAGNMVRISAGADGILTVDESAMLEGDTIVFRPVQLLVFGHPASAQARAQIDPKLSFRRTFTDLPLGLSARSLSVTPSGIELTLTGGPAHAPTARTRAPAQP